MRLTVAARAFRGTVKVRKGQRVAWVRVPTRHRHGTVVTDDFTGLASHYADESLRPLWDAWLYSPQLPDLDTP